jgi:hypothetical protein
MCMRDWNVMFGCDRRVVLGIVKSRVCKVCIAGDGVKHLFWSDSKL